MVQMANWRHEKLLGVNSDELNCSSGWKDCENNIWTSSAFSVVRLRTCGFAVKKRENVGLTETRKSLYMARL